MLPTDKFFVPREEILKLTKGSFEHLSARIEKVVSEEKSRLFENANVQVLATYPAHVVVLTDAGKVFSTKYEESAAGELRLISAVEIDASIYPRQSMGKYLRKEARAVADLYVKGLVAEAALKMSQLARLVDADAALDDQQVVETFASQLLRSRSWRSAIAERTEQVGEVLGESYSEISANKLRAKFFKLYDGSLSDAELENYRGLVNEDLGHLMKRIHAVRERTLESVSRLREVATKVPEAHQETVATFEAFVNDLVTDLTELPDGLAETIQGVESVGALGKLYDTVAEELLRYEVAGGFAVQMTNRLAVAS
jgi:hypothetical protein